MVFLDRLRIESTPNTYMLIDEQQSKEREESPDNLANLLKSRRVLVSDEERQSGPAYKPLDVRPSENGGSRKGDKKIPGFLREIIAITAQSDTAKSVADAFGVSKHTVDYLSAGQKSDCKTPDSNLKSILDEQVEKARALAISKLMESMLGITPEKLDKTNARDLSTVAANMSKVVVSSMPASKSDDGRARVIIYAPEIGSINDYKTLNVNSPLD